MEAPLGVGARGLVEAPDSRGRGRGAGGRARKPGWEAGAGAPGAATVGAGPQPGRAPGPQTGWAVPGRREKPGPKACFRRKRRCHGPSAGRSIRDLGSPNAAHQGGSGGCAGEKPARSGAKGRVSGPRTGATGREEPFSWRKKPGFPGDCPRRVTGSRLCARSRTRTRARADALGACIREKRRKTSKLGLKRPS